ncbi:MAG TPA: glycosyl transferase [Cyanobacteria bacterium UBA11149]|nr:glycosyl transferase [Cyanobacteria bacterium UBA11367]HBE60174.1 glycosyl transferase [Cyanobacteria bacterium UBA11366]HBK64884.1 glycosyl transferase [Cyanobacteria bacterium UBA11166]HBR75493.1 glycosyl transferase [Cyanobacteria bacterium UBA11159]HBS70591.1 glycosyl transferase [Cyanobacteria bacterium UBA11153]HBW88783.1 glycosyl transferase [Cyanobacteria bacterium UBA11149]HCA98232.1 glycosyl transferase [Cyanobacteria bacterium UBA9226]
MPRVSIIIPLYNKANYIAETIQSAIAQTFPDWEILIVDNGSTDGSWETVQEIHDSRIRLLQSPKQGPGAARNYGLSYARAEWIQFLDADDWLEADHLEKQLTVARQDLNADIIACYWQEFTDENPAVKTLKKPSGMGKPIEVLRDSAIAFAPWAVHAALVKRAAISPDYYWPEQLDQYLGEDIAFWFRLVNKCKVAYGDSQGALYRIQTSECRTENLNPQKWFAGIDAAIKFNQRYLENHDYLCTPRQCEMMMRVYSQIYLLARQEKSPDVELQALSAASRWLREYFQVTRNPKPSMLVRHLIGIKPFLRFAKN